MLSQCPESKFLLSVDETERIFRGESDHVTSRSTGATFTTESGEDISNKEVKAIIEGIVSREDKTKPLSDQKIAQMLEGRGFRIARRTVTKYREQLGVPVARLRKEIVLS